MASLFKPMSPSLLLLLLHQIIVLTAKAETFNNNNNNNNTNSSCYYSIINGTTTTATESTETNMNAMYIIKGRELQGNMCNWFQGKWVFDPSYPLYQSWNCPFIDPQFNCQKYGRPDNYYLKYKWQPFFCDLPKFNGLYFLEKWRGKKIMFVGDSLSLNQWQSLTCMLHSWVPNSRTAFIRRDGLSSVTFEVIKFIHCLS